MKWAVGLQVRFVFINFYIELKPLIEWTKGEVQTWLLSQVDFQEFASRFLLSGKSLVGLTQEDYQKELGNIMKFKNLKERKANQPALPNVTKISLLFSHQVVGVPLIDSKRIPFVEPASPCNTVGKFVELMHFNYSGLDIAAKKRLFVRSKMVTLWNFLMTSQNWVISGPPGSGKSCLVWAWCLYIRKKFSVCWIHITRFSKVYIAYFTTDELIYYSDYLSFKLYELLVTTNANILVMMVLHITLKSWQELPMYGAKNIDREE